MTDTETPAARIAGDLAIAIHRGSIRAGQQLPSQTKLMASYGVAMGTAASALAKLQTAGLTVGEPGRGTYAVIDERLRHSMFRDNPIFDVLDASALCRNLASTSYRPDATPTVDVGGHPYWGTPDYDPEKHSPPRQVDASALVALDRHILRWMSEAFLTAARRLVADGPCDADRHLIASARAILRDCGRRPEDQEAIAYLGGPEPDDEDVILRIWPERGQYDPDGPPF
ncbi:hypothetical protein GCM10022252_75140 [Streptosporangium oxazolinicum]|uniref:HTH gntR-type domain-containing protein n=1 Tax=Streptosporangium oxazolinicum TaxID=909287 RepID=A0ABP8BKQ9_9ACTN